MHGISSRELYVNICLELRIPHIGQTGVKEKLSLYKLEYYTTEIPLLN